MSSNHGRRVENVRWQPLIGRTNISETTAYIIKIPTATYGSRPWQTPIGDSNNDRQSEMASETGNTYTSVKL